MAEVRSIKWNLKQQEIIKSLTEHNRIFVEGGVRSGKSVCVAWMIDYICRKTPGMVAYVFRKSYEQIKTDTHVIFGQNPGFLTPDKGKWADGKREFRYNATYGNSIIYFRHADDIDDLAGPTAGLIFFEQVEQIREDVFDYAKNTRLSQWGGNNLITRSYKDRLSQGIKEGRYLPPRNYLFMTANPRAGWIKGRYIDKNALDDNIKHFHVSTYDNLENLSDEYRQEMENASEQFRRRYFEGSWQFNSGLIYPEFDDANIVEPPFDIDRDFSSYRTLVSVDPGYSKSKFAVLLSAILPDGRLYIFDEVVKNGKNAEEWEKVTIPDIAKAMKEKYFRHKFVPSIGLIDPASNAKIAGMESITKQFQTLGIHLKNANKPKEMDSIYKIKQLFKDKKIIVNSRCVNLIRELGLFRWHEKKIDIPVDEDNDCLDALRYIVNESPKISPYDTVNSPYERVYESWLKEWYGKEPVAKGNSLKWKNNTKLDYGL
jgi:phage terminase large subunit